MISLLSLPDELLQQIVVEASHGSSFPIHRQYDGVLRRVCKRLAAPADCAYFGSLDCSFYIHFAQSPTIDATPVITFFQLPSRAADMYGLYLKHLAVSSLSESSDKAVAAIIEHCLSLTSIELEGDSIRQCIFEAFASAQKLANLILWCSQTYSERAAFQ